MRRLRAIWLVVLTSALVLLLAFGFALQQQPNRSTDIPPLPSVPG